MAAKHLHTLIFHLQEISPNRRPALPPRPEPPFLFGEGLPGTAEHSVEEESLAAPATEPAALAAAPEPTHHARLCRSSSVFLVSRLPVPTHTCILRPKVRHVGLRIWFPVFGIPNPRRGCQQRDLSGPSPCRHRRDFVGWLQSPSIIRHDPPTSPVGEDGKTLSLAAS